MWRDNHWFVHAGLLVLGLSASAALGIAAGPLHWSGQGAAARAGFGPVPQYDYGPGYGFGYYTPFLIPPTAPPAVSYLPKYWWTGYYDTADPRQAGYNPRAGYRWDDVTTLILGTSPKKAEITLDGSPIGSASDLGPIQLPPGDHTLRVEAPGFEPSETVLKADAASVRRLQINLKATVAGAKPSK